MEYLQYRLTPEEITAILHKVLNLIINGIPSILTVFQDGQMNTTSFKPYYKWNTFNTLNCGIAGDVNEIFVLNLIINGIPSIPNIQDKENALKIVLNLIINGIPSIQL